MLDLQTVLRSDTGSTPEPSEPWGRTETGRQGVVSRGDTCCTSQRGAYHLTSLWCVALTRAPKADNAAGKSCCSSASCPSFHSALACPGLSARDARNADRASVLDVPVYTREKRGECVSQCTCRHWVVRRRDDLCLLSGAGAPSPMSRNACPRPQKASAMASFVLCLWLLSCFHKAVLFVLLL